MSENRLQLLTKVALVLWVMSALSFSQQSGTEEPGQTRAFGISYSALRPEQKRLVDDQVGRYNTTTGNKIDPQQAYDGARLSVRTTFDAVTHALLTTEMTDARDNSLGHAIDIVEAIDEVMGEEEGVGGDRQYRLYVYLKPSAFDVLAKSHEFTRERDNTVYHKGFPTCFRLKNGPPSIQFSMSRDRRMADIDVDYRSSSFPAALFNGHLTASNSDVRAGNNLDRHDNRWTGLNGWWRQIFGFSLDSGKKSAKETRKADAPLNPKVRSGVDAAAHDFLKNWIVDKRPNDAIAYLSRRSYPCFETEAKRNQKPIPPGMVRVRVRIAMEKFGETVGAVSTVGDAFEAADNKWSKLKTAANEYPSEFRLVSVPPDVGSDEECIPVPEQESTKSREKYYGTAFREKRGANRDKIISLLWAQEGKYWKIVAIRLDDSGHANITPSEATAPPLADVRVERIHGDPKAVNDITDFYRSWLLAQDTTKAASYVSPRSYSCLGSPPDSEKNLTSGARIRATLEKVTQKIPNGDNLAGMMSTLEPVNELVRPVEQESSGFSIMAVPEQMADGFLCEHRQFAGNEPALKQEDAKYGKYYISASQLTYSGEESPALLLLWAHEQDRWKIWAWAVEIP